MAILKNPRKAAPKSPIYSISGPVNDPVSLTMFEIINDHIWLLAYAPSTKEIFLANQKHIISQVQGMKPFQTRSITITPGDVSTDYIVIRTQ